MSRSLLLRLVAAVVFWLGAPAAAPHADEATVAVAANFLVPLRALATAFEMTSDHEIVVVAGSTGQLYAQIVSGAPFDAFLAADHERPRQLAAARLGLADSVFTYAAGRLVLWSRDPGLVRDDTLSKLPDLGFRWLAIAEPDVAPYGAAARQALVELGHWSVIEPRIVRGQNVAQAFAMAETGNAELGLVALSQALAYGGDASYRVVSPGLHDPIRQDAILLRRGAENAAARAFLEFVRSSDAASIIERFGYSAGDRPD
jgi:molybdate transport system substrate-binding protein